MTTPDGDGALPRKRGRSVPAIYGIVSLVLVVGAVTFALSTPPPNTPPLAAVAPAPQEQLEVERVEQSSRFGEGVGGEGDCAPGDAGCAGVGETPPAEVEEHDVPGEPPAGQDQPDVVETRAPGELRRCVHGPGGPRQTEDPQSPPCMREIFTGDNGGATSSGVTATEIRVGYAHYSPGETERTRHALDRFVAHVNDGYELYRRRIELVEVDTPGDTADPAVQRAHAQAVIDADVFAMLSYDGFGAFQHALADHGVVTLLDGWDTGPVFEADIAALHPYAWSLFPGFEHALNATGELICSSLASRPARHGGADVAQHTRQFGLLVESAGSKGGRMDPTILLRRLEACGVDALVQELPADDSDVRTRLQRFSSDGVTTVVCVCRYLSEGYTEVAEDLDYHPEWLLPGISDHNLRLRESSGSSRTVHPREQIAHVFGLTPNLRQLVREPPGRSDRSADFWWHAAKEVDPEYECFQCYHSSMYSYGLYAQLVVLASGIQWAGSDLTPTSFAEALTRTTHPNPRVGQAPWFQPSVGFGPGDHGFNSDYALLWWRDPDDAAYDSRTDFGEMCYVEDGRRFAAATIPADADELFFDLGAGCR